MSKSTRDGAASTVRDGAASTVLSDDKSDAAGAELYAKRRAEARANVAVMLQLWAAERA